MQTAKARFSEVVKSAKSDEPQDITVHGKSVAVVQFMQSSSLYGMDELVFEHDKSVVREIDL